MSFTRLVLASVVILGLSAGPLPAAEPAAAPGAADQASLDALLSAIRSNRKALVAANLQLTDAEAGKFWPVYERYQKAREANSNRLVAVLQDYSANFTTLSDEKAMKLMDEYLSIEAERVKLKRDFVPDFAKALPGRKLARFYQIENKMDAVIRYDLASTIPVIEEKSAAPAN
jgi:hypothetical protein